MAPSALRLQSGGPLAMKRCYVEQTLCKPWVVVLGKVLWAGKAHHPLKQGTLSGCMKGILLAQWRQWKSWFEKGWAPATPVVNFEGKSGVDVAGTGARQGPHQSDGWMAESKAPQQAPVRAPQRTVIRSRNALPEKERPSHAPMSRVRLFFLVLLLSFFVMCFDCSLL